MVHGRFVDRSEAKGNYVERKGRRMDFHLEDKVAIVTGAARGIGRSIALTLCQEGAKVVIDDIDLEAAKLVEEEARTSGSQAYAIKADVTNPEEVKKMVNETLDIFGHIDILVNNAGILYNIDGKGWPKPSSFQDSREEDWPRSFNVTLYSALYCSKAVLGTMVKQKSGNIVNITSYGATNPRKGSTGIYPIAKGGIISLTKNLSVELLSSGIRINCVSPGLIRTTRMEMMGGVGPGVTTELNELRPNFEDTAKQIPAGRAGSPQEVANVVVFLASDVSSYINGQIIIVTGAAY